MANCFLSSDCWYRLSNYLIWSWCLIWSERNSSSRILSVNSLFSIIVCISWLFIMKILHWSLVFDDILMSCNFWWRLIWNSNSNWESNITSINLLIKFLRKLRLSYISTGSLLNLASRNFCLLTFKLRFSSWITAIIFSACSISWSLKFTLLKLFI